MIGDRHTVVEARADVVPQAEYTVRVDGLVDAAVLVDNEIALYATEPAQWIERMMLEATRLRS